MNEFNQVIELDDLLTCNIPSWARPIYWRIFVELFIFSCNWKHKSAWIFFFSFEWYCIYSCIHLSTVL